MRTKTLALAAAALAPVALTGCGSEGPIPGIWIGAIPAVLWLGLFILGLAALLASVQNGIWSLIYLAGRRGNDDLPPRDALLARRALEASSAAPAAATSAQAAETTEELK
jgi:hypothetical protein